MIIKEKGSQIFHPLFDEYIKNLQLVPKMANAPSLCIICFCLLNIGQRSLHECSQTNPDNIKTASKYCSAENLIVPSEIHQNHKIEGNFKMIRIIRNRSLETKQKSRKNLQIAPPENVAKSGSSSKQIICTMIQPNKEGSDATTVEIMKKVGEEDEEVVKEEDHEEC